MTRPTLSEVAQAMGIEPSALGGLPASASPVAAVRRLLDEGRVAIALRLVTGLLPRAYLVAWACQCARNAALSTVDAEGVALAETCLRGRQDDAWKAALSFAMRHGFVGVGAMLAASAGWSTGGLVDADGKTLGPAPAALAPRMAAGAVLLAAMPAIGFESCCRAFAAAALTLLPMEDS